MISLEQLRDGSTTDRNFQKLMSLVLDTGGLNLGLRFGTSTLAFTASTDSANRTVTHGLGRTPVIVLACASGAPNFTDIPAFNAFTLTSTTFGINGRKPGSSTVNISFYWAAIG